MFLNSEIGTDCTDRRKADSSNYSHLINLYLRCSDLIGREIENLGRRQKINRTHFQNVIKPRHNPYDPQKHWKRKKPESDKNADKRRRSKRRCRKRKSGDHQKACKSHNRKNQNCFPVRQIKRCISDHSGCTKMRVHKKSVRSKIANRKQRQIQTCHCKDPGRAEKRSGASRRKLARKLSSISIPFVKPPCISPSWPG